MMLEAWDDTTSVAFDRALWSQLCSLRFLVRRVYAGVHYLADTVVGLLFGAVITVAVVLAVRGPATRAAHALLSTWGSWIVTTGGEPLPSRSASGAGSG